MSIDFFSHNIFLLFILTLILSVFCIITLCCIAYGYKKNKIIKKRTVLIFIILFVLSSPVYPLYLTLKSRVLMAKGDYYGAINTVVKAIKLPTLPVHKGYLYAMKGYYLAYLYKPSDKEVYFKAKEDFDNSYKYLKTYKTVFAPAAINVYLQYDLDKAELIMRELNDYEGLTLINFIKDDYNSALENATKAIAKNPTAENYIIRSAICKILGQTEQSNKDYNYAKSMCKNDNQCMNKLDSKFRLLIEKHNNSTDKKAYYSDLFSI